MNREKGEFSIHEDTIEEKFEELLEKNVPTNPKLWSKFKAQAKAKFDVYPSAYANGWHETVQKVLVVVGDRRV